MSPRIIDGNAISAEIRKELRQKIEKLLIKPKLAVMLCGNDSASLIYVKKKIEACEEVGVESVLIKPFGDSVENWMDPNAHLRRSIHQLNEDHSIHGILVQLPLPYPLDSRVIFDNISPVKDVDVFSPFNVGLLLQGRPRFIPCTPAGIQEMLTRSGIQISGKKVAIINRSDIVGKPLNALLIQNNEQANATCTMCHDHTPSDLLRNICRSSEIIVVAVGIPNFLTPDMVSEGSVVVDVGINRVEGRIVGDVHPDVYPLTSAYTPVPKGVGPMTVTMLLRNTLSAFAHRFDANTPLSIS